MSDGRERLALIAAAAVGVQVGLATVASRFAIAETTPAALALMRYVIGSLCLLPIAVKFSRLRFAAADLAPIALLGIVQFAVLIALLNYGLKTVPAARAALVLASYPLITLLLAAALGWEKLTAAKGLGVTLTMLGVGVALAEKLTASAATGLSWSGDIAILGATVAGAVCSVLYRPYLERYPALGVGTFAMLASVAALLIPATFEGFFDAPLRLSASASAAVIFIGLSSGIGYFLWLWALANTTPTRVTIFMGLSPLTAALVGMLALGEPLTWHFVAGLLLVVTGLWIANRAPRTHRVTPPSSPPAAGRRAS